MSKTSALRVLAIKHLIKPSNKCFWFKTFLHIFIACLHCISLLHSFVAHHYCISLSQNFIAYRYIISLFYISIAFFELKSLIAYLYCILWMHTFIAHLYCASWLHIHIASLLHELLHYAFHQHRQRRSTRDENPFATMQETHRSVINITLFINSDQTSGSFDENPCAKKQKAQTSEQHTLCFSSTSIKQVTLLMRILVRTCQKRNKVNNHHVVHQVGDKITLLMRILVRKCENAKNVDKPLRFIWTAASRKHFWWGSLWESIPMTPSTSGEPAAEAARGNQFLEERKNP